MRIEQYINVDDWGEKYNIGDMFIDSFSGEHVVSYIYSIEYEPNSRITYYWIRYCNDRMKDTYWTTEELDNMLNEAEQHVKHYPVKK